MSQLTWSYASMVQMELRMVHGATTWRWTLGSTNKTLAARIWCSTSGLILAVLHHTKLGSYMNNAFFLYVWSLQPDLQIDVNLAFHNHDKYESILHWHWWMPLYTHCFFQLFVSLLIFAIFQDGESSNIDCIPKLSLLSTHACPSVRDLKQEGEIVSERIYSRLIWFMFHPIPRLI